MHYLTELPVIDPYLLFIYLYFNAWNKAKACACLWSEVGKNYIDTIFDQPSVKNLGIRKQQQDLKKIKEKAFERKRQ